MKIRTPFSDHLPVTSSYGGDQSEPGMPGRTSSPDALPEVIRCHIEGNEGNPHRSYKEKFDEVMRYHGFHRKPERKGDYTAKSVVSGQAPDTPEMRAAYKGAADIIKRRKK